MLLSLFLIRKNMNCEMHITVREGDIDQFTEDCKFLGIKPILIETERNENFGEQLMTSSKCERDDYLTQFFDIFDKFIKKRYEIIRLKIEKFPDEIKDIDFIYYESHLRLKLEKNFDRSILVEVCKQNNFHLSKNLFKRDENFDYQMITYRDYDIDLNSFKEKINHMVKLLDEKNIIHDKIEIEECIYDSNISLDNNWLIQKSSLNRN